MGMRRWMLQRLAGLGSGSNRFELLHNQGEELLLPQWAELDLRLSERPWSVSRMSVLLQEAALQPSVVTLQAARQVRHRLSTFWLEAPTDHLEDLYQGALGSLQQELMQGPLMRQVLARDERQWLDQLTAALSQPDQKPRQANLLVAWMPYASAIGLTVVDPSHALPQWLLSDYVRFCEPGLEEELNRPMALLEPADPPQVEEITPLSNRRGEEAMAWFKDEAALSRVVALINQYGLNPADTDVLEELSGLRSVVAQLWLDVEPEQLKTLFDTPVGLVTQSLISSGFGQELVDDDDERARRELPGLMPDLSDPQAQAVLLALMLFYPSGAVTVEDPSVLPEWLGVVVESLQSAAG